MFSLTTIILFVHNIQRMQQFYTGIFECRVTETSGGNWVLLNTGGSYIGLHTAGPAYQPANGENSNIKLVFNTGSDIFAFRETLLKNGVPVTEIKTFEGYPYWFCDGEDPEGNKFQVRQLRV